jgi:hypothetical protein
MVFVGRNTYAKLHPESASVRHDALAERLPQGIVGGKRAVDVVVTGKCLGEGLRLCARETPNPMWGRGVEAASPTKATRPNVKLGEQKS